MDFFRGLRNGARNKREEDIIPRSVLSAILRAYARNSQTNIIERIRSVVLYSFGRSRGYFRGAKYAHRDHQRDRLKVPVVDLIYRLDYARPRKDVRRGTGLTVRMNPQASYKSSG